LSAKGSLEEGEVGGAEEGEVEDKKKGKAEGSKPATRVTRSRG
jgi:hypothetical protein